MQCKKIIPAFGCRGGQPVRLRAGGEPCQEDLISLSRYYDSTGADELMICDLSETDEDHERTIGIIKEAARSVDIPILTGGRVRRLEDVKKYLYTGAGAVFLDVSLDEQRGLIKEAASRFGGGRIYAYLPDFSYLDRAEEYARLGASMMILKAAAPEEELLNRLASSSLPLLVFCHEGENRAAAEEMLEAFLKQPPVQGILMPVSDMREGGCMVWKQELKKRGIQMSMFESKVSWEELKLGPDGLLPVIVQDYRTLEVLMLAYMNEEAFYHTLSSGRMTYYSRSRGRLWIKGETSGHVQYVKSLKLDCDSDTLLAGVHQVGPACHTGARSCFFTTLAQREYRETNPLKVFQEVSAVILDRKEHPKAGSYTNYLFDKGLDKILKKLGEEAAEIIIAAKNPNPEEIKYEISDFLYHMMVLMADRGITWEEITEELANR